MERPELTPSMLEYLVAAHDLDTDGVSQGCAVRNVDIADRLGVSKAATTKALRKLDEWELIEAPYYGLARLTETGRSAIEDFLRRRELARSTFVDVGVPVKDAQREAHAAAKALSLDTLRKLRGAVK